MEQIDYSEQQKPKYIKLKIFGIIFGIVILVLISISVTSYYNYKNNILINNLNQVKQQIEQQTGQEIIVKETTKKLDPSINNPLTSVNPRWSFLNSSNSEVAYIAHDGSMGAINNLYFNYTSTSTGYFSYLGSLVGRITKLWVIDIDMNGTLQMNGGNITNVTNIQTVNLNATTITATNITTNILNVTGTIYENGTSLWDKYEPTLDKSITMQDINGYFCIKMT